MREKLNGSRQKLVSILNRRCNSVPRERGSMFVSDSSIFSSGLVKLSVISIEGGVWNIDAAADVTVEKLKTMALCHFYSPLERVKVTSNYKLVLVSGKRPLDNDNSVLQEGLRDNGDYCLVFVTRIHMHHTHHLIITVTSVLAMPLSAGQLL
jgi:hypothetical protein